MNYPKQGNWPVAGNWPVDMQMRPGQPVNQILEAAKNGAMVGATGAAALSLHQLRQNQINWQQALSNTAKAGAAAGLATGAATSVGQVIKKHPLLSMAAAFATGTAVMYYLNQPQRQSQASGETES
mgnify:CR=1 FL=1